MTDLVLLDIDGTLLHSGGAGRAAMREAAIQVLGRPGLFEDISFVGSVDGELVPRAMRRAGIAATARRLGRFRARYRRALLRHMELQPPVLLPGAARLVHRLAEMGVSLGLQTGNFRSGAEAKLRAVGLWEPFVDRRSGVVLGGFGDGARRRDDLVVQALHRARRRGLGVKRVVVVGDTPADIECSRAGAASLGGWAPEVFAVAVETGWVSGEALAATAPQLQLRDLATGEEAFFAALGYSASGTKK